MFLGRSLHRTWLWQVVALLVILAGCGDGDEPWSGIDEGESVGAYGRIEGMISTSAIQSANGTYGPNCARHRNQTWSVAFSLGAPLDNEALQVVKLDTACTLALTALRTGTGASNLYVANTPVTLGTSYDAGALFTASGGSFAANAKLTARDFATTFGLTILVAGDVRTGAQSVNTYVSFSARVLADSPRSYWRLDDTATSTFSMDDFAGAANATLQSRAGALGASWTKHSASGTDAIISSAGRVRVGVPKKAVYLASGASGSADYSVSADVYAVSLLGDDIAGVVGRAATASETYYVAGIVATYQLLLVQVRRFELWKVVNGVWTLLGSYASVTSVGNNYRIRLDMRGSTIRAALDDVEAIVVNDTSITAAGSAGIFLGAVLGLGQSDTTGLHIDNFSAKQFPAALDSKGTNHGLYDHGLTPGAAGAFTGSGSAATFDGVDDYIDMNREIGDDFSIELWFKSTQGLGAASVTQWYQTAGLLDANASASNNDFGIGLRSDGRVLAGTGKSNCVIVCSDDDRTIVSSGSTAYNDGAWHHVVFTRTKASGAAALYVDGVAKGTLSGASTNSLNASTKLNIGRLQTGANYFAGSIDEVVVYTSVLSAASVLAHYQAGRH